MHAGIKSPYDCVNANHTMKAEPMMSGTISPPIVRRVTANVIIPTTTNTLPATTPLRMAPTPLHALGQIPDQHSHPAGVFLPGGGRTDAFLTVIPDPRRDPTCRAAYASSSPHSPPASL